jgi:nucleotide-binding universal stress UspA family protein
MIGLKHILVATDFSTPSDAALAYGRELARTFGARFTLLHVVENLMAHAIGPDGILLADPEMQAELERRAHARVYEFLSDEDRRELGAKGRILVSNVPPQAIVDYARDAAVDLIVMGTHGRGAVGHLLMGNVAERVVRTAPCPVLTVREHERDLLRPDALVAVARA